jgi:cytidylate kinase
MIIAVDGPTASGKGTIARALAAHYRLPHLDTGLLYRAVGLHTITHGGDPDSEADAINGCEFPEELLDHPELRTEAVGGLASRVSRHPSVRAALLARQQAFAGQPGGAVLDGRDIGTVIAPDADAKLFVTGSLEIRAARRLQEMRLRGLVATLDEITADLAARDSRDSGRDTAPLVRAADAALLDTSDLTIEEAVQEAIKLVDTQLGRHAQA